MTYSFPLNSTTFPMMVKTKNFEIDMNKLENVTGGKEIWWCSELEIDRPLLAESRRPQFGIELEFGRPVKPPVVASESILRGSLINPRDC